MSRPTEPRADFPPRARPSVRRVMFLDYDWIDLVDVRVTGAARDEVTGTDGAVEVAASATLDVETRGGAVATLACTPSELDPGALLGHPLRQGFRSRVRAVHDGGGRPLGLLLDDLPGALIAAGYVHAMQRLVGPGTSALSDHEPDETPRSSAQADLCSGWRSDGTMMVAVRAGEMLPFEPVAPVTQLPGGADGWPPRDIPVPGLRRHRRIDVVADRDGERPRWRVDAWFRDTYRDPEGACGALHEYTVQVLVDAVDHTLLDVRAVPHALPWRECPAAGEMVYKVIGTRAGDLRSAVPKLLRGIESCTHLTNELRELADVPHLASLLPRAAASPR